MKWTWARRRAGPEKLAEVYKDAADYADRFVAYASDKGGWVLDYSQQSLIVLEEMLAHLSRAGAELPADERSAILHDGGFYLLEVGRRQFGGIYKFYVQREQIILVVEEPDFGAAMLAHDKIEGRLNGDEGDNIPFHYEGFRRAVETRTSVLYV